MKNERYTGENLFTIAESCLGLTQSQQSSSWSYEKAIHTRQKQIIHLHVLRHEM
jgi:hypothetical protein